MNDIEFKELSDLMMSDDPAIANLAATKLINYMLGNPSKFGDAGAISDADRSKLSDAENLQLDEALDVLGRLTGRHLGGRTKRDKLQ